MYNQVYDRARKLRLSGPGSSSVIYSFFKQKRTTTEASALVFYFQDDRSVQKFGLIFIETSELFNQVADLVSKLRLIGSGSSSVIYSFFRAKKNDD